MNSSAKEIISPFEKLLADLTAAGVDFAVVGGVAVIANGYLRLTEDLDILVSDHRENLTHLLEVLSRFGEGYTREWTPGNFQRQEGAIWASDEFDVNILTVMGGLTLDDFRPRLRRHELTTCSFLHLSPDQLIELK